MSWTDVFPVLDDDHLTAYENLASAEDRDKIRELFRVAEVFNSKPARHIVATSLFWKGMTSGPGMAQELDKDFLMDPSKLGQHGRVANPWQHYVEPIFEGARKLSRDRPDVTFRVYLANDMAFVIPELVQSGCEVFLMGGSSSGMQPGMMWRFLALEHDGLVTVTDADRAGDVIHDIDRTERIAAAGIAHWRVAYTCGREETRQASATHYRPVMACQFGSSRPYPMVDLMAAFIWNYWQGKVGTDLTLGPDSGKRIMGSQWPDYGFDEWFLQTAFFPRMAFNGVLTFVPWSDRSLNQWFALDIEYCTWANPISEIFYHDDPAVNNGCTGDPSDPRIDVPGHCGCHSHH